MRRLRFGLNVVALERDLVPPEGPFDVAMTNGLAAIVASVRPGDERGQNGQMLSARALLKLLQAGGPVLDFVALHEALDITQPLRHARADDEFLLPVRKHLHALVALDDHPALLVLARARTADNTGALVADLYIDAAREEAGIVGMSPKDRLEQPDLEECDECWRTTFVPGGIDEFGGTNSPGRCVACGYKRDADTARRSAFAAELTRLMDKE